MQQERTIKIGIIGLGARAETLLASMFQMDNVEVTDICDVRQERIDRIYGRNTQKKRPHHLPYVLTADDFDNDELIQAIENSPTYLRNRTTLNQLKEKSVEVEKPADDAPITDGDGIIHFG